METNEADYSTTQEGDRGGWSAAHTFFYERGVWHGTEHGVVIEVQIAHRIVLGTMCGGRYGCVTRKVTVRVAWRCRKAGWNLEG